MNQSNPFTPPSSNLLKDEVAGKKTIEGIGGWLILVAIGIVFAPIRIVAQVFPIYWRLFSNGSLDILTTPGTAGYNPLWMPYLIFESTANVGLVIAWLYIAVQFFRKKRRFPALYVKIIVATFVFQLVDAFSIMTILPDGKALDSDTIKEIGRTVFSACIWIPYLLISKRAKVTFVHD